jgi:hypothetical protein
LTSILRKKNHWKKANLSDNIKNFIDENSIHHVLDESPKSEIFNLDVKEVDFLGVENILSKFIYEDVFYESFVHHMLDESPKSEVFDLDANDVDFLGVENILSNSLDVNVFDDFYADKNFMFRSEEIVNPFWEILMTHEREKMCDNHVKLEFFESS